MRGEAKIRWYDPVTLVPVDEVPKKDGTGMMAPRVANAKKMGLLPSVTSVLDMAANMGLSVWKEGHAIKTAALFPFDREQTDEEVEKYVKMIRAKAGEYGTKQADIGTEMHAELWDGLEGKDIQNPVSIKVLDQVKAFIAEHQITDLTFEMSFGSAEIGYAGTPDVFGMSPLGPVVLDYKTQVFKDGKPRKDDKYGWQLGGYRKVAGENARLWNMIACRETGVVVFKEHTDADRQERAWNGLFDFFCAAKNYDAREAV